MLAHRKNKKRGSVALKHHRTARPKSVLGTPEVVAILSEPPVPRKGRRFFVMATITVAIKFTNRAYERYYDVTADVEFAALKDEIKAGVAKFTGDTITGYSNVWYLRNKAALDALKARHQVTPSDVRFQALGSTDIVLAAKFVLGWNRKDEFREWETASRDVLRELQTAYNQSDEAFIRAAIMRGAYVRGGIIADMLAYHSEEEWAKEIIQANQ